ncbi:MAG: hypothetical protein ACRDQW_04715 [Haloechinothrix sp.]
MGAQERRTETPGAERAVADIGLKTVSIEAPGRRVVPVRLREVLHLKSAVTGLPNGTFLALPRTIDKR